LVGFEVSPLLWKQLSIIGLSAGRVQSVVVRLIMEKEEEINNFWKNSQNSYFKFKANFIIKNGILTSVLYKKRDKTKQENIFKGDIAKIEDYDKAKDFLNNCKNSEFQIYN